MKYCAMKEEMKKELESLRTQINGFMGEEFAILTDEDRFFKLAFADRKDYLYFRWGRGEVGYVNGSLTVESDLASFEYVKELDVLAFEHYTTSHMVRVSFDLLEIRTEREERKEEK